MGKKQKAAVQDMFAKHDACKEPLRQLQNCCAAIVNLNTQIAQNPQNAQQLRANKNPWLIETMKAERSLENVIPPFKDSITKLEELAKKKAKKWHQPTVQNTKDCLDTAKAHLSDIEQTLKAAINLS